VTQFFRRIRFNLMEKTKTKRYLKYAIGEIILVVIGILIALQINNWNERRKLNLLKTTYIKRLISDVKKDTANINYIIADIKKNQLSISNLISTIDSDAEMAQLDSAFSEFFKRGWIISEFAPSNNTYVDLSQTGNMKIINNTNLVDDIIEYYGYIDIVDKSNATNKDWITPLDIEIAKLTPAFEIDPTTKHLFSNTTNKDVFTSILSQQELVKRNAAGHYWVNTSFSNNLIALRGVSESLIVTLQNELNNSLK
jgi:Family of unknown function (DUF6090)